MGRYLGEWAPAGASGCQARRAHNWALCWSFFGGPFRNGEREKLTWVHFPVFLLARSTIITFCRLVVRAAAAACSYGDKVLFLQGLSGCASTP